MKLTTKKLTTLGMLCALAIIVNLMIHFPIVPAVSFLSYDPKDVVILIGGFIYGPSSAILMSAIVSVLELMYRGGTFIDVLMNMISTLAFVLPASYLYKNNRSKKSAIYGLVIGIVLNVIVMLVWNYIVTPIYYQMPREAVVALLLPGILPFNLIKSSVNAIITLAIYKPIVSILRKGKFVSQDNEERNISKEIIYVGLFIAVTLFFFYLGFKGII